MGEWYRVVVEDLRFGEESSGERECWEFGWVESELKAVKGSPMSDLNHFHNPSNQALKSHSCPNSNTHSYSASQEAAWSLTGGATGCAETAYSSVTDSVATRIGQAGLGPAAPCESWCRSICCACG